LEILDDAQATYEPSTETLEHCIDIFSTFANLDTMRIFLLAKKGISNSNKAIKELDLTPKRYYSRLKDLIDCKVIEKVDGKYVYTPTGQVLAKMGLSLIEVLNNEDRIELLLNLSESNALTLEERDKINEFVVDNFNVGHIIGPILSGKSLNSVEKILSYDELVRRINEEIDMVEKSLYLATTYFDPVVGEKGMKKTNDGIKTKLLMSKKTMSKKMTKLRMLLSPKSLFNVIEMMRKVPVMSDFYRETDLKFSFMVIDEKRCIFEFPNIIEDEFTIAFFLCDRNISKKFIDLFNDLWENADVGSLEMFNVFKHL